jgi:non-ribosomal peptide synthetase component F
LPQRIAEQARLRPTAIALVHGQQRLSFAELEARAADIQVRWGLPALKWLKVFKPLEA